MSKRNEKLSAHLDGEIHHDELMSFSLSSEKEDAATAVRYQLIGDVLRGETSELSTLDVSNAVSQALANENIAGAVTPQPAAKPANNAGKAAASGSWFSTGWLRPLGGMAVAATVAVVMVVAVTQQPAQTGAQMAAVQPVVPVERPVSLSVAQETPAASVTKSVPVVNNPELIPYLNQHFATQGTLQSRMPYVRAVSYESGK